MLEYDFKNQEIADIVNNMIIYAVSKHASDIHFDPFENGVKVRFRIDGLLQDHTIVPTAYQRNLITRVKLISNMNITESRLPQDGAIKGNINGIDLDMRVSSLTTNLGEKIVIRILDYTKSTEGLDNLGFSGKNLAKIKKMIAVPNGIILVTGATGTGKSTTVYTMLQSLNTEDTNIITVEDPIEMNIEGINQVQVNSEIGLTFGRVLRSILRQDPNIILIGEIRDDETAQIAVRASITGHLVFSTIHTNNSLSTIERLLDMNVERYLLSSALTGIVSQKLARRLCPNCRKLRPTTLYEKKIFKRVLKKEVNEIYDAEGHCDNCRNGYSGRIAIQEVLLLDDNIRNAINSNNVSRKDLRKLVYTDNVTTLLQDGLEKVIEGITSFGEIYKIVEIDNELDSRYEETNEEEMNLTDEDIDKKINEAKENGDTSDIGVGKTNDSFGTEINEENDETPLTQEESNVQQYANVVDEVKPEDNTNNVNVQEVKQEEQITNNLDLSNMTQNVIQEVPTSNEIKEEVVQEEQSTNSLDLSSLAQNVIQEVPTSNEIKEEVSQPIDNNNIQETNNENQLNSTVQDVTQNITQEVSQPINNNDIQEIKIDNQLNNTVQDVTQNIPQEVTQPIDNTNVQEINPTLDNNEQQVDEVMAGYIDDSPSMENDLDFSTYSEDLTSDNQEEISDKSMIETNNDNYMPDFQNTNVANNLDNLFGDNPNNINNTPSNNSLDFSSYQNNTSNQTNNNLDNTEVLDFSGFQ